MAFAQIAGHDLELANDVVQANGLICFVLHVKCEDAYESQKTQENGSVFYFTWEGEGPI